MKLRDTGLKFSPITLALHWITVGLVLAIIAISIAFPQSSIGSAKSEMKNVQSLLAIVLFFVSVYRLWARSTSYHPLPVGTPNPVEVIVSRSVAVALALALVLLPIAAWFSKSAAGESINLPGGFLFPAIIDKSDHARKIIDLLFNVGSLAFLAGLALHIFGALKNHFLLKNDALKRMLGKHVEF